MTGSLMQLAAFGIQDEWLKNNPSITFFKKVYKKHTNFSRETRSLDYRGEIDYGEEAEFIIDKVGDLLSNVYLEIEINNIDTSTDNIVCNIGSALIDTAILEIGGQVIDKLYGHWLEVWAELTQDNESAYSMTANNLTNGHKNGTKFQNMSCYGGVSGETTITNTSLPKFFIPLNFWFTKNINACLPLVSLFYHDVTISITFNEETHIISNGTQGEAANTELKCKMYAEYIYLDNEERLKFANKEQEILIEQLQFIESESNKNHNIDFKHPVKEIVWTGGVYEDGVSTDTSKGISTPLALLNDNYKIEFNGSERIFDHNLKYYSRILINNHHNGCGGIDLSNQNTVNDSIAVYSFSLNPENYEPSGTCNFSRLDNVQLISKLEDSLYIYALNYNVLKIKNGLAMLLYSN